MKYFKVLGLSIIVGGSFLSFGPPNCNLFEDDCKEACIEAEQAIMHSQGSKASQIHFDKSIELCPTFAYSYYEKAVPFAKRGSVSEWNKLMDNAVKYNPEEYLGQRGWYHFFFMHNYQASITDIERLQTLYGDTDIGVTGDAMYHLHILRALCYKGLGQKKKAIRCIEDQMAKEDHYLGLYDYLHLGVLYLENGNLQNALEILNIQIEQNPWSEAYYYRAQVYKQLQDSEKCIADLNQALVQYKKGDKMHNSYRQLVDEIYESDILDALKSVKESPSANE